ncbi:ribosome assembly protein 1 [Selaginella moellendorffii]|uniref:ribosome assembly protein 1 n=1 Tax=Selaginella moellendorffii TaxID=88036 RepID=UPI000D1CFC7C|nr:ribosome assembly protein 1 [Selaginella moellendorffii]|eukprot:XP_024545253.1 ribosome assembly protein 1 [Selaginella moellendorffii]
MVSDGGLRLRERTRNICILAHVDHGKTTLADHLIAAAGDGVVHPKQAGKLRYLDFLDDEQQRCITIKSASIALRYRDHAINLIDSPGHIDFCGEVSTAVRLSDGALVLVDVCEGIHVQTHAVLRQAWLERVAPCLVLNKVDRLVTELKLSPLEAYRRMERIIAEVNGIVSGFRSESYFFRDGEQHEEESGFADFSPVAGNVAFASALDGWAFRTHDLVEVCEIKLDHCVTARELEEKLWGDFFLVTEDKKHKIVSEQELPNGAKTAAPNTRKPLFVRLILESLWQVYSSLEKVGDESGKILSKVTNVMKLSVPERELRSGGRASLQAVMSRWLPLSDKLLDMVVQALPDPARAQAYRSNHLLPPRAASSFSTLISPSQQQLLDEIEHARMSVKKCDDSRGAPCVVYVSKMFAVPASMIPRGRGDEEDECFLAFARVFSGVLVAGQRVYVLSDVYDPTVDTDKRSFEVATVTALYVMIGQGLKPVDKAAAGNVVAIQGLGEEVLKTATLSSSPNCWPLAGLSFQAAPIVRVAVEPSNPANLAQLLKGLKLLNRADPMVQVTFSSTGEYVLSAAGEVHLELCVKELRERFARVELEVSAPLVAFRETIDDDSAITSERSEEEEQEEGRKERCVSFTTPNRRYTGSVEVWRLPSSVLEAIESSGLVKTGKETCCSETLAAHLLANPATKRELLGEIIWSCCGANLLVSSPELLQSCGSEEDSASLESSIVTGFQLACTAGPLCKEPLWGLAFRIKVATCSNAGHGGVENSGQVIKVIKEACLEAVAKRNPRLVEAMYLCEVSTSSLFLGQMYGVLARRRARVVKEEMAEGRDVFAVVAFVPVAESFGLAEELRKRTSGAASPQLRFSHWEVAEDDGDDELEMAERDEEQGGGFAKRLIDAVRRRKGLAVKENLVRHAAKQRTLARKV